MFSLILSIIIIIFISLIFTSILLYLNNMNTFNNNNKNSKKNPLEILTEEINNLLPQTQCGQCNYPGCKPYATAISQQEADINLCPPGGQEAIDNIAKLLNIESKLPIDNTSNINNRATNNSEAKQVAIIKEDECIGCLLCIKACPVDAIVGANKTIHTVITDKCTGCDLCIAPCPMDCITMVERKEYVI